MNESMAGYHLTAALAMMCPAFVVDWIRLSSIRVTNRQSSMDLYHHCSYMEHLCTKKWTHLLSCSWTARILVYADNCSEYTYREQEAALRVELPYTNNIILSIQSLILLHWWRIRQRKWNVRQYKWKRKTLTDLLWKASCVHYSWIIVINECIWAGDGDQSGLCGREQMIFKVHGCQLQRRIIEHIEMDKNSKYAWYVSLQFASFGWSR